MVYVACVGRLISPLCSRHVRAPPYTIFKRYLCIAYSVVSGHFDCLRALHSRAQVFGVCDESGSTPLHAAMESCQLDCAQFLIDRTGADLHARLLFARSSRFNKLGTILATPPHITLSFMGSSRLLSFCLIKQEANGTVLQLLSSFLLLT